jgi:hypothetical protein
MKPRKLFSELDPDLSGEGLSGRIGHNTLEATVPVRLTRVQRDQLAEIAKEMGLSLSGYLRRVVLGQPVPPRRAIRPIPEINQRTYAELGFLSTSVKQLAMVLEEGAIPVQKEIIDLLKEIVPFLMELRMQVLGLDEGPSARGKTE